MTQSIAPNGAPIPPDAVLLTPRELAARHRTSVGHLANLRVRSAGVPYLKIGSRVVYRLADVEAYEAAALVKTASAA